MREKKFSVRLTEDEDKAIEEFVREKGISKALLFREAAFAAIENPAILNPVKQENNLDVLLNVLEESANRRIEFNEKFQKNIVQRLEYLEKGLELIMNKVKIPKKKQKEIKGDIDFESAIFD